MLAAFTVLLVVQLVSAQEWEYEETSPSGPTNWYKDYPDCAGERQSPVDIVTADVQTDTTLGDLVFNGYNQAISGITLVNVGHSVQVKLPTTGSRPYLSGGGLPSEFTLEQIHFHWSQENDKGSEHTVDGESQDIEMHLVHFDSLKYSSVSEAVGDPNGVAVLGVLISTKGPEDVLSVELGLVSDNLNKVTYLDDAVSLPAFSISGLLPPNKNFYRYMGSLTTPGCAESVIWTVFKDPMEIPPSHMTAFRTVHGHTGEILELNYRPTQALNGRKILSND